MNTMTTKTPLPTLLSPLLLGLSMTGHTDIAQTPAHFNFSGDELVARITLDNPRPLNVAVYCQSEIATDGENLSTRCFEKSGLAALESQVEAALKEQTFKPATIDGENIAVRMNYRVIYQANDNARSVLLIPNLGSLQQELGVNYSEPQERLDNSWFNRVAASYQTTSSFFSHHSEPVRAKAIVQANGESRDVTVIDKTTRDRDAALYHAIKSASFVPGFVDGKPAEMGYLAILSP